MGVITSSTKSDMKILAYTMRQLGPTILDMLCVRLGYGITAKHGWSKRPPRSNGWLIDLVGITQPLRVTSNEVRDGGFAAFCRSTKYDFDDFTTHDSPPPVIALLLGCLIHLLLISICVR